jgi:hypothetical protein
MTAKQHNSPGKQGYDHRSDSRGQIGIYVPDPNFGKNGG